MKTLILSLTIAVFSILFSWVAKAIDENSFVLYFPFNEGMGNATQDLSQNKHTGILTGEGVKWTKKGKFGGALEFNGIDGHVNVAKHDNLSLDGKKNGSFTVMAWIFPKAVNKDFRWVMDKSFVKDGASAYRLGITSKNRASFTTRKVVPNNMGPEIRAERWYHVVGVQDEKVSKQAILYVDGLPKNKVPLGNKVKEKETDLKIGARNWAGGDVQQFFKGIIDEVAIFNRALTKDEIKQAMKGLESIFAVNDYGKLAVTWSAIKVEN